MKKTKMILAGALSVGLVFAVGAGDVSAETVLTGSQMMKGWKAPSRSHAYEYQPFYTGFGYYDTDWDSDFDGVLDKSDRCPTTPRGRKVDEVGCQMDGDGDGVMDFDDQCPTTPKGERVDRVGCALDSDKDGVFNRDDQCPNTPMGAQVNAVGCWVLKDVKFHTGSAQIQGVSHGYLKEVAGILTAHASLRFEVQGHTDNVGGDDYNQKLSERRAAAVRSYLVRHGVSGDQLTANGYGENKPVASNETAEGRAENRRVEMKWLR